MSKLSSQRFKADRKLKIKVALMFRDGARCHWCGKGRPGCELSIDHVKQLHSGGADDLWNLVLACPECNVGREDKAVVYRTTFREPFNPVLDPRSPMASSRKTRVKKASLEVLDLGDTDICEAMSVTFTEDGIWSSGSFEQIMGDAYDEKSGQVYYYSSGCYRKKRLPGAE